MTQDGQTKVLNAGFTVIRTADYPDISIKKLKSSGVWVKLENFPTKDRKFKEMLKDAFTIQD